MPTFYTNRALCYLKLKKWDEAVKDCKRALDLDNNAVKGHYFLGEAYMELNMFDESINNLSKGLHGGFLACLAVSVRLRGGFILCVLHL